MMQNSRDTAFTVSELLRENQQGDYPSHTQTQTHTHTHTHTHTERLGLKYQYCLTILA